MTNTKKGVILGVTLVIALMAENAIERDNKLQQRREQFCQKNTQVDYQQCLFATALVDAQKR